MVSLHGNRTGTKTARETALLEQSSSASQGQIKVDWALLTIYSSACHNGELLMLLTVWISEMLL